jgi:dTMP kinase
VKGLFVTFEGGEGSGKSVHTKALAERLRGQGKNVTLTREPGGAPGSEAIRKLLVTGEAGRWSADAETLLNYAARDEHLRTIIRPALASRGIVICDRFMDSTRVYQGYAGDCDLRFIDTLERYVVADTRPDLTIILDIDPELGLSRAQGRGNNDENRFEKKGIAFHRKIRDGFLHIAKADPARCRVIDSSRPSDDVDTEIWKQLSALL